MKKLLVLIIVAVFGVSLSYGQTPYTGGSHDATGLLTSLCIRPLSITPAQFSANLPLVIKGQVRTLPNHTHFHVWHCTKENFYSVKFNVQFSPYPVAGVKLEGNWDFYPDFLGGIIDPQNPGDAAASIPNSGEWNWDTGILTPEMFCVLYINKIDATEADETTPSLIHFTATINAYYDNL